MKIENFWKLVIALALPQLAGLIGTIFTTPAIPTWYAELVRPALNPPSWVFAPVWTLLFLMMGVAFYMVWKEGVDRKEVRVAMWVFGGQLMLNTLWSIIFFGLQNPGLALIEIVILWGAILATILFFAKVSKRAAWLLVPYLAWVSFATYLTFGYWILN